MLRVGRWYYRRRLPRPYSGEVLLALGDVSRRQAGHLARILDVAFYRFFQGTRPVADIKAILAQELREALEADRQQYINASPHRPVYTEPSTGPEGGRDQLTHQEADLAILEDLLGDARDALRARDASSVKSRVAALAAQHGIPEDGLRELGLGLLRVNAEVLERSLGRIQHGEPLTPAVDSRECPVPDSGGSLQATGGLLFSEAADRILTEKASDGAWGKDSLRANRTIYTRFVEMMGDLPVNDVTPRTMADWLQLLKKVPKKLRRDPRMPEGIPISDGIKYAEGHPDVELLSPKTQSKYLSAVRVLFNYLADRGELVAVVNPVDRTSRLVSKSKGSPRLPWDSELLERLLASPNWSGCRSEGYRYEPGEQVIENARYWLPLLAMYQGARREELAQLWREDVRQEDGLWVLDIHEAGHRSLKNVHSVRKVPIHDRIIELGFLDFARPAGSNLQSQVFPELERSTSNGDLGESVGKWFTRYRQRIDVYREKMDLHAFRHTFITRLQEAGVPQEQREALSGHASEGVNASVYSHGSLPLQDLKAALDKLRYPEDRIVPPKQLREQLRGSHDKP